MGNYVTYETTSKFNSFPDAHEKLDKYFTVEDELSYLIQLLTYGYVSTKWWNDFNHHMTVASSVLNEPLVVFYEDEDGFYDCIDVYLPDGEYYGNKRRDFVLGLIDMFKLNPLDFVGISNSSLVEFLTGEGLDMVIEYTKKNNIEG